MSISIIAAIGKNRELGKNGDLIWHIPEDLKYFRTKTMEKTIIMGKNTFNSLPMLLPGRKHIILSEDNKFNKDVGDSIVFHNPDWLTYNITTQFKDEEVFIVGGASMYKMFIDICDKMYLTRIDAEDKDADVYFPAFNVDDWEETCELMYTSKGINVKHMIYTRKN